MDQLGNTEGITDEPGTARRSAEGWAGTKDASDTDRTLAVFRADPGAGTAADGGRACGTAGAAGPGTGDSAADPSVCSGFPDGFSGTLALANLESFDNQATGEVLVRVAHLIAWAEAQRARLLNRMETIFREDCASATGRVEPGMAFTLAAAECATLLQIPHGTAQRLMFEAGLLSGAHTATLEALQDGSLSYGHAQVVLDQCESVPAAELPDFEAALLKAAQGQTRSQFSAKARRLREKKYPQTLEVRHLTAFEKRRVSLDREEDGMSCLSAYLRAAEAQQIYTALSTAARGEQSDGDSRTTDQLRSDILAQLLMGGLGSARFDDGSARRRTRTGPDGGGSGDGGSAAGRAAGSGPEKALADEDADKSSVDKSGILPRAEIMVLINSETLFGANEDPAELHGYGPISAEAARRLARNATHWTGLVQDPDTGEILSVGRRRKVPAGLARWLRARDGTCRFPGCRVSTAVSEIDHTTDWAAGGPTDHGNLSHLCRRHHRFKTLGFWKARQPEPGVMEWTSPSGRVYRTEPFLELAPPRPVPDRLGETVPPF
ncbi:HNH endonuclease signature motif containing protein [Arthrobacter sp. zg-Y750]|uniref:HNH endonuclease signature motif containing protein n=1 Tax=Arthrobacter sp. zg-Y750 TaxID=2894189 RepID=UPI001E548F91|nr:HNH endonuclease signature motif containing protein [Arthrobacter sp. zg-Y750]MCC9178482.1 HNH endonuclease [Arthrobacter sp. zg-Y750]